jgi:hypothetical protein
LKKAIKKEAKVDSTKMTKPKKASVTKVKKIQDTMMKEAPLTERPQTQPKLAPEADDGTSSSDGDDMDNDKDFESMKVMI